MNIETMRAAAQLIRMLQPPFKISFDSYRDGGTKLCTVVDTNGTSVELTIDNRGESTTKGCLFVGYPGKETSVEIEVGSDIHKELGSILGKYIKRVYEDKDYVINIANCFCSKLNLPDFSDGEIKEEAKKLEIPILPYVRERKVECTLEELICAECGEIMEKHNYSLMSYYYKCPFCKVQFNSNVEYPRISRD